MTSYEEKCHRRNIETLELIVKESKEKRDSLEKQLIKQARLPIGLGKNTGYSCALINSIQIESSVIGYMENQIIGLELLNVRE